MPAEAANSRITRIAKGDVRSAPRGVVVIERLVCTLLRHDKGRHCRGGMPRVGGWERAEMLRHIPPQFPRE